MANRRDRLRQLQQLLEGRGPRRVTEIAAILGVSAMTVRRDALLLEEEGRLQVFHGALIWRENGLDPASTAYRLRDAQVTNREEKERIACLARELVEESDTVMVDAGSTTEALALQMGNDCRTTFITYSLNAFLALGRLARPRIILAGGEFDRDAAIFRGSGTIRLLQSIRATKAFLSAGGISLDLGVTCSNAFEYELKRSLMEYSLHRVLLADHTKLGHAESTFYASLEEFDVLVTDRELPPEYAAYCREHKVDVLHTACRE
jgi:DeoR family deoxyribose operon repressor